MLYYLLAFSIYRLLSNGMELCPEFPTCEPTLITSWLPCFGHHQSRTAIELREEFVETPPTKSKKAVFIWSCVR
jgi:hypothetical protein